MPPAVFGSTVLGDTNVEPVASTFNAQYVEALTKIMVNRQPSSSLYPCICSIMVRMEVNASSLEFMGIMGGAPTVRAVL